MRADRNDGRAQLAFARIAGRAEAWVDGQEDRKVTLRRGDTVAIPAGVPHSFRVVGDEVLRLLGTHASPTRMVNYKDGGASDAQGYRVYTPPR